MRTRKTTLQRILEITGGDNNVPVVQAGYLLAGHAARTTYNQLSAGTFPLSTFKISNRRFVLAGDLAAYLDARRAVDRKRRSAFLKLTK